MASFSPLPSKWKTDWTKCCLCQTDKKNEDLKSPPTRYKAENNGYTMIATNVPLFKTINEMPIMLDPTRLDASYGIEESLIRNNAKYHQSCRKMFNNTKLERARKRVSSPPPLPDTDERQRYIVHEWFMHAKCFSYT